MVCFQEWQARANAENVGLRVRWKTVWDQEYPHAWTSFLAQNRESVEIEMREVLHNGMAQTPHFVTASFTNFTNGIGENFLTVCTQRCP